MEIDVRIIYVGIRKIAYLKLGMSFNENITFFNDDHVCWDMLKWVREGKIEVYCECVVEKGNENINEVVESEGINAEMDGE